MNAYFVKLEAERARIGGATLSIRFDTLISPTEVDLAIDGKTIHVDWGLNAFPTPSWRHVAWHYYQVIPCDREIHVRLSVKNDPNVLDTTFTVPSGDMNWYVEADLDAHGRANFRCDTNLRVGYM